MTGDIYLGHWRQKINKSQERIKKNELKTINVGSVKKYYNKNQGKEHKLEGNVRSKTLITKLDKIAADL